MYSINFADTNKKFAFEIKDSEILAGPMCLGNISKDWSVDNMKKLD